MDSDVRRSEVDRGSALPEAVDDLTHLVHNASNLVLGHLDAIERTCTGDRLDHRIEVITGAVRRITEVVDAFNHSLGGDGDPGPPHPEALHDVVLAARRGAARELGRRGVAIGLAADLDAIGGPDDPDVVADGRRATAVLTALLNWSAAQLGTGGRVRVVRAGDGPGLDLELRTGDDEAPALGATPSVWWWVAEQATAEGAGALALDRDQALVSLRLPAAGQPSATKR